MAVPYPIIEDTPPWTQAIAGSNQFIYSTDWSANTADDILVYSRLPSVPTSDILQLIPSYYYTVQFIGDENIVQVTFLPGYNPPQYNIVTIMRDTSAVRLNLYTNTNFTPSMLNSDFGTLTFIDQDNQLYWQQIVPRYNNSATVNVPIDTILPILTANQFWVKNSSNTEFVPATLPTGGGTLPISGPFVTWTAEPVLTDAFNLGLLSSGILIQNVVSGVSTPAVIPYIPQTLWSPVLMFGGSNTGITYAVQQGLYTKIGNTVTFSIYVQLTSKGSSTGIAQILGLPIPPNVNAPVTFNIYCDYITFTHIPGLSFYPNPGISTFNFIQNVSGNIAATLTDANFANNSIFTCIGTYLV